MVTACAGNARFSTPYTERWCLGHLGIGRERIGHQKNGRRANHSLLPLSCAGVGVISAAICGAIAPSRGHSAGTWAVIGFLAGASLGPIGLGIALVVLFAQPNRKRQMVYCPRCAQPLPYPVPACPRCGLSFVPPYPAYPPAPTDPWARRPLEHCPADRLVKSQLVV